MSFFLMASFDAIEILKQHRRAERMGGAAPLSSLSPSVPPSVVSHEAQIAALIEHRNNLLDLLRTKGDGGGARPAAGSSASESIGALFYARQLEEQLARLETELDQAHTARTVAMRERERLEAATREERRRAGAERAKLKAELAAAEAKAAEWEQHAQRQQQYSARLQQQLAAMSSSLGAMESLSRGGSPTRRAAHMRRAHHLSRFTFLPCATSSNSRWRIIALSARCAAPMSMPWALRSESSFDLVTVM